MSSAKVMSLKEGSEITLVARAGTMDGYDWFKVSKVELETYTSNLAVTDPARAKAIKSGYDDEPED